MAVSQLKLILMVLRLRGGEELKATDWAYWLLKLSTPAIG
jgi:hypothetical protein